MDKNGRFLCHLCYKSYKSEAGLTVHVYEMSEQQTISCRFPGCEADLSQLRIQPSLARARQTSAIQRNCGSSFMNSISTRGCQLNRLAVTAGWKTFNSSRSAINKLHRVICNQWEWRYFTRVCDGIDHVSGLTMTEIGQPGDIDRLSNTRSYKLGSCTYIPKVLNFAKKFLACFDDDTLFKDMEVDNDRYHQAILLFRLYMIDMAEKNERSTPCVQLIRWAAQNMTTAEDEIDEFEEEALGSFDDQSHIDALSLWTLKDEEKDADNDIAQGTDHIHNVRTRLDSFGFNKANTENLLTTWGTSQRMVDSPLARSFVATHDYNIQGELESRFDLNHGHYSSLASSLSALCDLVHNNSSLLGQHAEDVSKTQSRVSVATDLKPKREKLIKLTSAYASIVNESKDFTPPPNSKRSRVLRPLDQDKNATGLKGTQSQSRGKTKRK